MIFGCASGLAMIAGNVLLYACLLFAIAGMATVVILGLHSRLRHLSPNEQVSRTTNSSQKEHLDETFLSRQAA
jgi:uncharacterized membrane protein YedE/YeeE